MLAPLYVVEVVIRVVGTPSLIFYIPDMAVRLERRGIWKWGSNEAWLVPSQSIVWLSCKVAVIQLNDVRPLEPPFSWVFGIP